jgi:hypothetical protein
VLVDFVREFEDSLNLGLHFGLVAGEGFFECGFDCARHGGAG